MDAYAYDEYDDAPDDEPICWECADTGWIEVKSPDDTPSYAYCACHYGQHSRATDRARKQRERDAERFANLPW